MESLHSVALIQNSLSKKRKSGDNDDNFIKNFDPTPPNFHRELLQAAYLQIKAFNDALPPGHKNKRDINENEGEEAIQWALHAKQYCPASDTIKKDIDTAKKLKKNGKGGFLPKQLSSTKPLQQEEEEEELITASLNPDQFIEQAKIFVQVHLILLVHYSFPSF